MFPVHRKAYQRLLDLYSMSFSKSVSCIRETLISTRKGISLPSTPTHEERMDVKVSGATGLSFVDIGMNVTPVAQVAASG